MDYVEISKETISSLHKSYASLKKSPLNPLIRVLLELRVSQINGCAYCCSLHAEEARELNIPQEKLDLLPVWYASKFFTEAERAALQWCESLTCVESDLEEIKEPLFNYYTEREIVDMTACIAIMNALNRLAISFKENDA